MVVPAKYIIFQSTFGAHELMKQEKVQRDIKEDKTQCMVRENRHFMFAILIPYFLFVFTKCLNTCLFHYDQIR